MKVPETMSGRPAQIRLNGAWWLPPGTEAWKPFRPWPAYMTIPLAGRWKWVWAGAAVFVLALAGGTILLLRPKTPPVLWPVSYEDSLARILGEIGEDADLAESFDQVLQASIGEILLQAENPTFWEGLGEDEIRLMELDITNGREI